ncbi:MAG: winged helix-turn-helix domain-containing protein [Nanobdellota archaeon]
MSKKRSKFRIFYKILFEIRKSKGKIKQTKLMYKANLSYKQMVGYLDELIDKKLIEKHEEEPYLYIKITDAGLKFLEGMEIIDKNDE